LFIFTQTKYIQKGDIRHLTDVLRISIQKWYDTMQKNILMFSGYLMPIFWAYCSLWHYVLISFIFFLIYMYCMRANKPKVGKHYLYMTLMLIMNIFTTSVQHRQQFSYNSYNILHVNCVYVNFVLIHTVSDLHTISVYMFFIKRSLLAHRVWARLTHVYVTKVSRAIMIKSFKWWRQLRCCEITFWACFMF